LAGGHPIIARGDGSGREELPPTRWRPSITPSRPRWCTARTQVSRCWQRSTATSGWPVIRRYAVRAHLLELASERAAARESYRSAARRAPSRPEQRYLEARVARLVAPDGS
jgi:hypothetical protein